MRLEFVDLISKREQAGIRENLTMGDRTKKASFSELALALAGDYESIYVISSEDDSYVE